MADRDRSPVVRLRDLRGDETHLVGPKAAALARMLRAGLPVPEGFCVTAPAFRDSIEAGAPAAAIRDLVRSAAAGPEARARALEQIRRLVASTPLPEALREAIARAWSELGPGPYAVRSSATLEDLPDRSFAGQHDTFLGVGDVDEGLRRIAECWSSLWSDRAWEYRRVGDRAGAAPRMAVLVQRLVPAEAAGVLFTADPASGRRDCAVIEAAWGLGESVVCGGVVPDRIVVSKRVFRIEERRTNAKAVEVVPCAGGTRVAAVEPERARRACLDDSSACRLARLGADVEVLFGAPLDIEWAAAGGKIFLLQARPITALPAPPQRSWEDRQVWTDSNVREAAPDPIHPMTWSIMGPLLEPFFGPALKRLGLGIAVRGMFGLVGGRVYFNVNAIAAMFRALPGKSSIGMLFGGGGQGEDATGDIRFPDADLPGVRVPLPRRLIRLPGVGLWFLRRSLRSVPSILAELRGQIDAIEARGKGRVAGTDEPALLRRLTTGIREMAAGAWGDACPALIAGIGCTLGLLWACRRWFGDDGGGIGNRLLSGMGGLADAEAGLALWRLSATARRHPQVASAVGEAETFVALRDRLPGLPGGSEWLSAWDDFMREHGHHATVEIEPAMPRWSETPDRILDLVRTNLEAQPDRDPDARAERLARERAELERGCERRLDPLRRSIFRLLLRRAQEGLRFRETTKSLAIRWLVWVRCALLELGDRLAARGALAGREDIFFITVEELEAVVAGALDARPLVAARRAERERNLAKRPPSVVFGRFDPARSPAPEPGRPDVLIGMAVSPGIAAGKARVILHDQADRVRPGEVLVAPIADPGWAPYFVNAAGIVIDQGGLLSHGSIVAREYGIPCVVNVGPASQLIATGQEIRVDGDRGVVTILAEPGAADGATAAHRLPQTRSEN